MPTLLQSVSLIALTGAASPFLMNWLADGDVIYTKVPEGAAKAIMRGGKSFNHMVMSLQGYHLNVPGDRWYDRSIPKWEVVKNPDNEDCDSRSFITRTLGLYTVGVPFLRSVWEYHFEWNEMKNVDGEQVLWSRSEQTDFIYVVSFPYVLKLSEAETEDNLPVDVEYQLTVRVTNPYKALFDTENWMEVVSGIVNGAVRNFVGGKSFDELRSETDENNSDDCFTQNVLKLNDKLPSESDPTPADRWEKGLRGKYGVIIEKLDIQRIDPAGPQKAELAAATVRAYKSRQEATEIRNLGEAKADADLAQYTADSEGIRLKGTAAADSIKARAEALATAGELAPEMIKAEALVEASKGAGSNFVWATSPFGRS